jgi:phosphopantothenoylcysteine synthetase/decarboxylase
MVAHTVSTATQEAKIRRIMVQSQPGKIILETLSQKYPKHKRADRVAQVVEYLASIKP